MAPNIVTQCPDLSGEEPGRRGLIEVLQKYYNWQKRVHDGTIQDFLDEQAGRGESVPYSCEQVSEAWGRCLFDDPLFAAATREGTPEDADAYPLFDAIARRTYMTTVTGVHPTEPWRVLVAGEVQSGKTSSYVKLIKSLLHARQESGSRYCPGTPRAYIFVVLSGVHECLRQQTQDRLEGELRDFKDLKWHTSSGKDITKGSGARTIHNDSSHILVTKKVKKPMEAVAALLKMVSPDQEFMLVVIDDECDQITVDSGRKLLPNSDRVRDIVWGSATPGDGRAHSGKFSKKGILYVGYSATPFANVLLDASRERSMFPQTHMEVLKPGPQYSGYDHFWPQDGPPRGIMDVSPGEYASRHKDGAQKYAVEGTALERAVLWFLLAAAGKRHLLTQGIATGSSSMLVNSHTRIADHLAMSGSLEKYLEKLRSEWSSTPGRVRSKLTRVWEVCAEASGFAPEVTLGDCLNHVEAVLGNVVLCVDNSKSANRPQYPEARASVPASSTDSAEPYEVIVVGGYTLSRGITLYGLVSSYFTRKMQLRYDTYLQAMRWMGYRPGYAGLCLLWMTKDISESSYAKLAEADRVFKESLEEAIDKHDSKEGFPEFGHEDVRIPLIEHRSALPAALGKLDAYIVTGAYGHGITSPHEVHRYKKNQPGWTVAEVDALLARKGKATKDEVVDFLDAYKGPDRGVSYLRDYVEEIDAAEWTVHQPSLRSGELPKRDAKRTAEKDVYDVKTTTDKSWRSDALADNKPAVIVTRFQVNPEDEDGSAWEDVLVALMFDKPYGGAFLRNSSVSKDLSELVAALEDEVEK